MQREIQRNVRVSRYGTDIGDLTVLRRATIADADPIDYVARRKAFIQDSGPFVEYLNSAASAEMNPFKTMQREGYDPQNISEKIQEKLNSLNQRNVMTPDEAIKILNLKNKANTSY